jgi:hypothetical protein
MQIPHEMTSLSEAMNIMKSRGYDKTFEPVEKGFLCAESGKIYQPEQLVIVKTFRFEGISDPADMSVLYVIEADDGTKGILTDAYGTYAQNDTTSKDHFKKIKIADEH